MAKVKITLTRSLIGRPATQCMIHKVERLITVA